jgi:hypothetical protein
MFVRASRDGENMSCLSIFFECSEVPSLITGEGEPVTTLHVLFDTRVVV